MLFRGLTAVMRSVNNQQPLVLFFQPISWRSSAAHRENLRPMGSPQSASRRRPLGAPSDDWTVRTPQCALGPCRSTFCALTRFGRYRELHCA